jgi:autotransporter-associated beta strand protein
VVSLGSRKLTVGGNNLSTTFGGLIQDGGLSGGTGGSLAKIGTRTLTLAGANLYTGETTVTSGDFLVANSTGSATGTGPVQVDGGRIGGAGTIAGPLTIGTGSGSGAILIPPAGTTRAVTTTIESALTLKADATYNCAVHTLTGAFDSVAANGVTIDPSATFVLHAKGNGTLPQGTVITPISNTAATAITGNFSGLSEGSTIVAGNNTYRVSYVGGDGNDLTLTVL